MRLGPLLVTALLGAVPFTACGSSSDAPGPADAGDEAATYVVPHDAGHHEAEAAVDAKTPWNRMEPHAHEVLANVKLQVVYLGFEGQDGAPSFDDFLDWLLTSEYWGIMQQYGVGSGTRAGSVRLPASAVIPACAVKGGLVAAEDLEAFIYDAIHPASSSDAGADADAADDASDGASSAPLIPIAEAYIFFLPNGVNVDLGERGGHVFQTCIDAGGYHSFDGVEPYAVMPPCVFGRSPLAVSHEIAEMVTDPLPNSGWYSDKDVSNAGGEIADLCNQAVPGGVEGWDVTQLWSNADGDCEPL